MEGRHFVKKIQFIDLNSQQAPIADNIKHAIDRVLEHGQFILGPEVRAFESALSKYTSCEHVISCANGTDALKLLLLANDVTEKDAIFVPTFTFASTAEVVPFTKATPLFVDICQDTYNIDLQSLEQGIVTAKQNGLNPKGIIAVDLFGLPANYPDLKEIADAHNMLLIADSAQSFGAKIHQQPIGRWTNMTATSFFPSKPLGAYGDGGAVMTSDAELAARVKALRVHGAIDFRYDYQYLGLNSRLDSIQAAVLIEKLKIIDQELLQRQHIAQRYNSGLSDLVKIPEEPNGYQSAWALYTIQTTAQQRLSIVDALQNKEIPFGIYYNTPLHLQLAYQDFPRAAEHLKTAEKLSQEVLSLPMHPYLTDDQVDYVVETVRGCF